MVKLFIDTNVLIDFLQRDRDGHLLAATVFTLILNGQIEAVLSIQSILDAAYVCRKYPRWDEAKFRESIDRLTRRTNVETVHVFELRDALRDAHPDLEDNAMIALAFSSGCDHFLTNDRELLSRSLPAPLTALTPEAFLRRCR